MGSPGIRRATTEDLDALVALRVQLQRETGELSDEQVAEVGEAKRRWFAAHLAGEDFEAWVAQVGSDLVACSGVSLLATPPYPGLEA